MKTIIVAASIAALAIGVGTSVKARQEKDGDILQKAINKPSANWQVQGAGQTSGPVKDKSVVGGGAVRVQVTTASDTPWAVAAQQPITGKVTKGDTLVLAFWAKAESVDGGPATAVISAARVQQASAPYDAALQGTVKVGGEWGMHTVPGKALIDIPAGGGNIALHLASARQTVVLGPVFVLDLGANYDPSKL
ncbi:MAG: carbohydrate binding domain-containing protein [bacterium]|nr:carbohydrate binding domain-containing protein [bacterium]